MAAIFFNIVLFFKNVRYQRKVENCKKQKEQKRVRVVENEAKKNMANKIVERDL